MSAVLASATNLYFNPYLSVGLRAGDVELFEQVCKRYQEEGFLATLEGYVRAIVLFGSDSMGTPSPLASALRSLPPGHYTLLAMGQKLTLSGYDYQGTNRIFSVYDPLTLSEWGLVNGQIGLVLNNALGFFVITGYVPTPSEKWHVLQQICTDVVYFDMSDVEMGDCTPLVEKLDPPEASQ